MRVTKLGRLMATGLVLLVLGATACTDPDHRAADFCDKLAQVTGPTGIESVLVAGDPARIDGVVTELAELHSRAPDEISATTRTLLNFFRNYQRAARDERRDVIADNETSLNQASASLDEYALNECGLFLQRVVPTAVPTVKAIVEAPTE